MRNTSLLWAQKVQRDLEIQDFTDLDVPTVVSGFYSAQLRAMTLA